MKLTRKRLMEMAGLKEYGNIELGDDAKNEEELGELLDVMMDDEEAMDQGLAPSEAIDYEEIEAQAKRLNIRLDMTKLQDFAENNDDEFVYSGAEILDAAKI